MIVGIDEYLDIDVFLQQGEVAKLEQGVLEGVVARWYDRKSQGKVTLTYDPGPSDGSHFGVAVELDNSHDDFNIAVTIYGPRYEELKERGVVSVPYPLGEKINIFYLPKSPTDDKLRAFDLLIDIDPKVDWNNFLDFMKP